ncbi:Uncharacterized membrane protein [Natronoarchaeum philippinense]|uniref:Uncharacterized membrane protein n=1 Tax=Natronoarchaeum philippinense TaxID=558529 RepID=A0A285P5A2_NATPI|nr:DUF1616 domain-containing protein [Natronoarchaeum philippinense]SNZ16929.1 Uncharacterized membrane protein [Natronoarchaeum philippinense]
MTHGDVETGWRARLRRSAQSVALDGAAIAGYLSMVAAWLYLFDPGGVLRSLLGVPLALFLPGYAAVAAAFPSNGSQNNRHETATPNGLVADGVPGWYERLALSLAVSLALLPLLGLVLASTRWGFSTRAVLVSLGGLTVLGMFVAVLRRAQLPAQAQFRVPIDTASTDAYRGLFAPETRFDGALNVVLILSIVVATSAVGYALIAPQSGGGGSTNFQLLTENESGELVASGYPDSIPPGGSADMVVAVTNSGDEQREYTVVVETHRVAETNGSLEVLERAELTRLEMTAAPGSTARTPHTISPSLTGETLRINYYLYQGDAPDDADAESADQHLWITVNGSAGGA